MEESDLIICDAGVELEEIAATSVCCKGRPNASAA